MNINKIHSLLKVIAKEFENPETDEELEISLSFDGLMTRVKGAR